MERKRKSERELHFRQDASFEGEEVFDCPGVDQDGETAGTVPKQAFIACREAFKNLERRYEESEKQNTELRSALKQGERKGSHSQAFQERNDLQQKLERSYLAFKEKYLENEQLKKRIADLELMQGQGLGQESVAGRKSEASPSFASVPEDEKKSKEGNYAVVLKLLGKIGLEVIEDGDELFVILTDRDKLKKWILESCDGNVTVEFERCIVSDEASETEERKQRTNVDTGVIGDQGQELSPFCGVVKEAMEQRGQTSAQTEGRQGSDESSRVEQDLRPPSQSKRTDITVARQRPDPEWSVFAKVRSQVADMIKIKDHLDKQKNALGTLVDLTRKASQELSRIVTPSPFHDTNVGLREHVRKRTSEMTMSHRQRLEDGTFERLSEHTPLSLPVQETEEHRVRRVGEPPPIIEGRNLKDQAPRPSSPITASTEGAEGGAVSMATVASQSAWTGESDIEVIEEDEEILAATSFQGRICPVCEAYFPQRTSQAEFEFHVTQHFEESVD